MQRFERLTGERKKVIEPSVFDLETPEKCSALKMGSKFSDRNKKWKEIMNRIKFIVTGVVICLFTNVLGEEFFHGNRGPIHLSPAWNLAKGDLTFHANSRFYFNNKSYTNPDGPNTAVTYWDIQGGANIYYGIARNYQVGLSQIIYQDNHKSGKGYNLPDDLFLDFRVGSFPSAPSRIKYGVKLMARFPVAQYHNVQLEPYSAGTVAIGIIGLASYAMDMVQPDEGLNAHVNLGIIDHNDSGAQIAEEYGSDYVNSGHSREVFGGLALILPTSKFDFSLELFGNYNVSKPPPTAFSRHNYAYVSPGITYKSSHWLSFAFGFDFRMTPNKTNKSDYLPSGTTEVLPTFPTWRVNFSMKMNLVSSAKKQFAEKQKSEVSTPEEKKDVYQEIAQERKKVENAEAELEKIRKERERMDEILKRLRKALENTEKEVGEKEKK